MGPFSRLRCFFLICACAAIIYPGGSVLASGPEPRNLSMPRGDTHPAGDPPVYVDQLIDEQRAEDDTQDWEAEEEAPAYWPGFSALNLMGRYYTDYDNRGGASHEYGLSFIHRTETLNNGSFEVSADGLAMDDRSEDWSRGGRVLLRQIGLVITDTWQVDNEIGHLRSQTPELIKNSYRNHLPSTLLQGVGTSIFNQRTAFSLTAGDIGALEGTAGQRFRATQGGMQGLSLTHRFTDQWRAAAQFWNTDDPVEADSHQSYAGAVQYEPLDQNQRHQMRLLADNGGRAGFWYDGRLSIGRWLHYTGFYRLQPGLQWTDAAIYNDRQGAYWRGEYRAFRWQWALGAEIAQNNIESDPDLAGYNYTQSFVNGSWRFRRDTLIGAALNVQTSSVDFDAAGEDAAGCKLKNWISHLFPFGVGRIQTEADIRDTPEKRLQTYSLTWDQVWKTSRLRHLDTSVAYVRKEVESDEVNMRLMVEKAFSTAFWIRGSIQYVHPLEERKRGDDRVNAGLGVNWRISPNWKMDLTADYNKSMGIDSAAQDTPEGHTVMFSVSYALFGPGRPKQMLGQKTGSLGGGEIRGRVYLDENRNGRYDINEKVLKHYVVILDGRFQAETDINGVFVFHPVAGGPHYVSIGVEDAPLPWGLLDDTPRRVIVPVRGTGEIDFPFIRLNE